MNAARMLRDGANLAADWMLLLALAGISVALGEAAEPAAQGSYRPYGDGPLSAADFEAQADRSQAFSAWTELDFDYSYGYSLARRGEWIVTLNKIEIQARIRRDKSWNKRPENAALMDHEQGHFDLMQTFALRAQCELHSQLQTVDVLQGRNASKAAAIRALETQLQAAIQRWMDEAIIANKKYDQETANGANLAQQATARRAQKQQLEAALTQWLKLTEK